MRTDRHKKAGKELEKLADTISRLVTQMRCEHKVMKAKLKERDAQKRRHPFTFLKYDHMYHMKILKRLSAIKCVLDEGWFEDYDKATPGNTPYYGWKKRKED